MGEGLGRAMRTARSRRLAVAGLLALSVFSCSYGDREDKEEDEKNQRAGLTAPATTVGGGTGPADRVVPARDPGGPGPSGSSVPRRSSIVHSRA